MNKVFKKILLITLLVVSILSLTTFGSVNAYSSDVIFSDNHNDCVASGKDIETTVSLKNGLNIIGFQIKLKYDETKFTYSSIKKCDGLSKTPSVNANVAGELLLVFSDTTTIEQGSDLFSITFKVNENVVDGDVTLLELDNEYSNVCTTFSDDNGQGTTSNIEALFTSVHIGVYGDVNNDGEVTINDVTLIQLHILNLNIMTDEQIARADVYPDGIINVADAARIQLYLAEEIASLKPIQYFVVTFLKDDEVLKQMNVESGKNAIAPTPPAVDGYTFIGWDKEFTNVTSNLDVKALYKANDEAKVYTVTFIADGVTVGKYDVQEGMSLETVPEVPKKTGYIGAWGCNDFSMINSNILVIAVYTLEGSTDELQEEKNNAITKLYEVVGVETTDEVSQMLKTCIENINKAPSVDEINGLVEEFIEQLSNTSSETDLSNIVSFVNGQIVCVNGEISYLYKNNEGIEYAVISSSNSNVILSFDNYELKDELNVGDNVTVNGQVDNKFTNELSYGAILVNNLVVNSSNSDFDINNCLSSYYGGYATFMKVTGSIVRVDNGFALYSNNQLYNLAISEFVEYNYNGKIITDFSELVDIELSIVVLIKGLDENKCFVCDFVDFAKVDVEESLISDVIYSVTDDSYNFVKVTGTVTYITANGYFLTDNTDTIYIYSDPYLVDLYDVVTVTGYAVKYFSMVEIKDVATVDRIAEGNWQPNVNDSTIDELASKTADYIVKHNYYRVSGLLTFYENNYYLYDINSGNKLLVNSANSWSEYNELQKYVGQLIEIDVLISDFHSTELTWRVYTLADTIEVVNTELRPVGILLDNNLINHQIEVTSDEVEIKVFKLISLNNSYVLFFVDSQLDVSNVKVVDLEANKILYTYEITFTEDDYVYYMYESEKVNEDGSFEINCIRTINEYGLKLFTTVFDINVINDTPNINSVYNPTATVLFSSPSMNYEGYEFKGYFYDEEFENPVSFPLFIARNLLVYAKWELIESDTNVTLTIHCFEEVITKEYPQNAQLYLSEVNYLFELSKKHGYVLAGFYSDELYENEVNDLYLTENTDLYLDFIPASEMSLEDVENYFYDGKTYISLIGIVSYVQKDENNNAIGMIITDGENAVYCSLPTTNTDIVLGSKVMVSGSINGDEVIMINVENITVETVGEGYDYGDVEFYLNDLGFSNIDHKGVYTFEGTVCEKEGKLYIKTIYDYEFVLYDTILYDSIGMYGSFDAYFIGYSFINYNSVLCVIPNTFTEKEMPKTTSTIYVKTPESWKNAYVYYWGNETTMQFPGIAMTEVEDTPGMYTYEVPLTIYGLVFSYVLEDKVVVQTEDADFISFMNLYEISESVDGQNCEVEETFYDLDEEFKIIKEAILLSIEEEVDGDIEVPSDIFHTKIEVTSSHPEVIGNDGKFYGSVDDVKVTFTIKVTCGDNQETLYVETLVKGVGDEDYLGLVDINDVYYEEVDSSVKVKGVVTYVCDTQSFIIMDENENSIIIYNKNKITYDVARGDIVVVAGTKGIYNLATQVIPTEIIKKGTSEGFKIEFEETTLENISYQYFDNFLVGNPISFTGTIVQVDGFYSIECDNVRLSLFASSKGKEELASFVGKQVMVSGFYYNYYESNGIWNIYYETSSIKEIFNYNLFDGFWKVETDEGIIVYLITVENNNVEKYTNGNFNENYLIRKNEKSLLISDFNDNLIMELYYDEENQTLSTSDFILTKCNDYSGSTDEPLTELTVTEAISRCDIASEEVVRVRGYVYAFDNLDYFYLGDENYALYVRATDESLSIGDEVIIEGTLSFYKGSSNNQYIRQISSNYCLVEKISEGNSIDVAAKYMDLSALQKVNTSTVIDDDTLKLMLSNSILNSYVTVTGVVALRSDNYKNLYLVQTIDGVEYVFDLYYLTDKIDEIKSLAGYQVEMGVIINGYNATNNGFTGVYLNNLKLVSQLSDDEKINILNNEINEYFTEYKEIDTSIELLYTSMFADLFGDITYNYVSSNENVLGCDGTYYWPDTNTTVTLTIEITCSSIQSPVEIKKDILVKVNDGSIIQKEVTFETEEGFSSNNAYNNTTEVLCGEKYNGWNVYYGCVSTNSVLEGKQSMQMRWYTSSPENLGYCYNVTPFEKVSKITFKAASTNSLNVMVSYSTDNGISWSNETLFQLSADSNLYTYNLDTNQTNVTVKFTIVLPETVPTGTSNVRIDEVTIYSKEEITVVAD